jgi:two-component system, OmpR family, phosphate regulon response regulator PhoB
VNNHTILVASSEPETLRTIALSLVGAGYHVVTAPDGEAALEAARTNGPSLIIVDAALAELDGMDVCRALKSSAITSSLPIVMLAPQGSHIDAIIAFELGVDDVVTKPFSARELTLRVRSILRTLHIARTSPGPLRTGEISMDCDQHLVLAAGRRIDLTVVEFKLLRTLLESSGRVQSRDVLLTRVWGIDSDIGVRTVDTHLRRLRDKLGAAGEQIQTVRGFGYRLDEAPASRMA